jgi:hypothetical protein
MTTTPAEEKIFIGILQRRGRLTQPWEYVGRINLSRREEKEMRIRENETLKVTKNDNN